jgi:hypothetical protein
MTKQLLAMAIGLSLAYGAVSSTGLLMQAGAAQRVAVDAGGWRFSDGYWNYWEPEDRAWYYTDGRHWYTYGNNAWSIYNFDKSFGKKYVREGYVVPKPGPDVVLPRHRITVVVP